MLCMGVAKDLGYTLTKLLNEATEEEIFLWSAYFGHLNDEHEKAMKAIKRKGR